jgi:hypothetical protein
MGDISYVQSQVPKMPRIRLESKPVSYAWFPLQVGPQVSYHFLVLRPGELVGVVTQLVLRFISV